MVEEVKVVDAVVVVEEVRVVEVVVVVAAVVLIVIVAFDVLEVLELGVVIYAEVEGVVVRTVFDKIELLLVKTLLMRSS